MNEVAQILHVSSLFHLECWEFWQRMEICVGTSLRGAVETHTYSGNCGPFMSKIPRSSLFDILFYPVYVHTNSLISPLVQSMLTISELTPPQCPP